MKMKCAQCGKVFDSKYPIPDSVPDGEVKCSDCEEKK
jgi:DNA-directed RNA polymerase subunit RPC12/RpoP